MAMSRAGGRLKLLKLPPGIMEVFVISNLAAVFDIFTAEEDAVNSFYPDRALRYPRLLQAQEAGALRKKDSPLAVFLCHASGDKPAVRTLRQRLMRSGVKPWLDEVDLLPGQRCARSPTAFAVGSGSICLRLTDTIDC